jgi:hypothetical protein
MQEIAAIDRLTLACPRVHDEATATYLIDRLKGLMGRDYVTFDERLRGGRWALDALARMAAAPQRYSFYDLIREQDALATALFVPDLMPTAAAALGSLATPEAQRMLLSAAGESTRPLAERQAAAESFAAAVDRRGVLLTHDEIWEQYDRYNASRQEDKATQAILGSLLDAIEGPSRAAAAEAARARPTIRPMKTPPTSSATS